MTSHLPPQNQTTQQQSSTLPPLQPTYVLRGHGAQVHSVTFIRGNTCLITGDADGWIILWSVSTKRAIAVWKPHEGAILGLREWKDKIITHGRDMHLRVWSFLPSSTYPDLSTTLPITDSQTPRPSPWLLQSLPVNTLNFCSFAMQPSHSDSLHIAVPSPNDKEISIYNLPSEQHVHRIPAIPNTDTGMIMALSFVPRTKTEEEKKDDNISVIAGYESGHCAIHTLDSKTKSCSLIYLSNPHTQPLLALSPTPSSSPSPPRKFFTSSADSLITSHPLTPTPKTETPTPPLKTTQTFHSGQQSLRVRNDAKILATAGWDGRIRIYSVKTLREIAVLKWHGEGCYCVDFARVFGDEDENKDGDGGEGGGEKGSTGMEVFQRKREEKARKTHWLAAGSKDGKVSLWDVY